MRLVLLMIILLLVSFGNTHDAINENNHLHGYSHTNKHSEKLSSLSDTLWVNKVDSKIEWIGKKIVGKHNGHIELAGGFIARKGGVITNGEILVNMQSITVDDIEAGKWNAKLVNHLKNDDFFSTDKYPTAKFIFDSLHEEDGSTHIHGSITIRDITKPFEMFIDLNIE